MINKESILKSLSPQEKEIYSKLEQIFSELNENEASKSKGVEYIKKNFKNFSRAMLISLLLNPTISSALNNSAPDVFDAIKTEIRNNSGGEKGGITTNEKNIVYDVNFSENFDSGQFQLTNISELKQKLQELKKFNSDKYTIKILASESLVTNQPGFEKGELASKRAEMLQNVLNKMGLNNVSVDTQIGTTSYTKGQDDPRSKKYKEEQFVRVQVSTSARTVCGLNDLGDFNGIQGDKSNDYIKYNEVVAGYGDVSISPGQIPDRLVITDKKGNPIKDLGYVASKEHDNKDWKYMPLYVYQLTKLYKEGNKALQSDKLVKQTFNSMEELTQFMLNNKELKIYKGSEVGPGIKGLQMLFDGGQREFVFYSINPNPQLKFADSDGDYYIRVFSPVGKTGYSLSGKNCSF